MFTGLVEDTGTVTRQTTTSSGQRIVVQTALDLGDQKLGDSIAVNGVCLTVVELTQGSAGFVVAFDVGPETMKVTAFRDHLKVGAKVHLERAMKVGDRLGGHIVSGHVDAVGTLVERRPIGDALFLAFKAPPAVHQLCIEKGSIAIDGVSLTINGVSGDGFDVTLIPHTEQKTHLTSLKVGDAVNLEADVIGKYVRRLMTGHAGHAASGSAVDMDLLGRAGFVGGSKP